MFLSPASTPRSSTSGSSGPAAASPASAPPEADRRARTTPRSPFVKDFHALAHGACANDGPMAAPESAAPGLMLPPKAVRVIKRRNAIDLGDFASGYAPTLKRGLPSPQAPHARHVPHATHSTPGTTSLHGNPSLELTLGKLSDTEASPEARAAVSHFLRTADYPAARDVLEGLIRRHAEQQTTHGWLQGFESLYALALDFEPRMITAASDGLLRQSGDSVALATDLAMASVNERFLGLLATRLAFLRQMPHTARSREWRHIHDGVGRCGELAGPPSVTALAHAIESLPEQDRADACLRIANDISHLAGLCDSRELVSALLRHAPASARHEVTNAVIDGALESDNAGTLISALTTIHENLQMLHAVDASALMKRMADIAALQDSYDDLDLAYADCIALLSGLRRASEGDPRVYARPPLDDLLAATFAMYYQFTFGGGASGALPMLPASPALSEPG
ncbi:hypothetical protein PMO31116_04253 [Pandoraea morbifera]|uniref:Uncharacterized protein n=1 Tax=Pandoraea morbifera TaxID=2508300 RepID=A0A5E4Y5I1_9BURK|nr:hypothetical protein [Pandoraea morbifera]VVE43824.1 hypothetical protein PMO31116_04253 [Pandoraea morbifera]